MTVTGNFTRLGDSIRTMKGFVLKKVVGSSYFQKLAKEILMKRSKYPSVDGFLFSEILKFYILKSVKEKKLLQKDYEKVYFFVKYR